MAPGGWRLIADMIIEKDMSTTRPEFFRSLAIVLADHPHEINGNHIIVTGDNRQINLDLSPLPARVLSVSWHMEHWLLKMQFIGYTSTERDEFLKTFDRVFQRGGG